MGPKGSQLGAPNPHQVLITAKLRNLGYKCIICENGKVLTQYLAQAWHPLILMDCHMPEMDGFEASLVIRGMEQEGRFGDRPAIHIVAVTADVLDQTEQRCLASGMDEYVPKPIPRDRLLQILESWQAPAGDPSGPGSLVPDKPHAL